MEFPGFRRPDGSVGIRQHIAIIPSVGCSAITASRVATAVPGAVAVYHQEGCGQVGPDLECTRQMLAGMGRNPNVYGCVVIGLGCEANQPDQVASLIAETGKPVELITIQGCGGTEKTTARGIQLAQKLAADAAKEEREPCEVSELIVGTNCGGSDACSGLSANPAVGVACDLFVEEGATVVLAETTELIGAEHTLIARAIDEQVARDIERIITRYEQAAIRYGYDVRGGNPAPGNIAGGLTTLEEKSLGAAEKGGSTPVMQVVEFAQRPTRQGLVIMDTPGLDVVSVSGIIAGGAQLMLFTTGRGTPTGNPIAPVYKIATNSRMYQMMEDNMDLNAGTIIDGEERIEQVGRKIHDEALAVCHGKLTKAEQLGYTEFGIWKVGVTL